MTYKISLEEELFQSSGIKLKEDLSKLAEMGVSINTASRIIGCPLQVVKKYSKRYGLVFGGNHGTSTTHYDYGYFAR